MKDLFNDKLSIKWSRATRQAYDGVEQWATKANTNYLADLENKPASL